MTTTLYIGLILLAVLLVYLVIAVRTWSRVRGTRLVVCPETQRPVAVRIDVGLAMASAVWEAADLRVTSCSRWPDRQDCDQPCVHEIETHPKDTQPRAIAARFFSSQRCAICSRPIDPFSRMTLQPGFMDPATRHVKTWADLPPEDLPRAIAGWRPLCSNCTQAESCRQTSVTRVTDRTP